MATALFGSEQLVGETCAGFLAGYSGESTGKLTGLLPPHQPDEAQGAQLLRILAGRTPPASAIKSA